jgi:hypothetical protein
LQANAKAAFNCFESLIEAGIASQVGENQGVFVGW